MSNTKAALLIAVSYLGTNKQLKSSFIAVEKIKHMLLFNYGLQERNIKILTDKSSIPSKQPTRRNIIRELRRLARRTNGIIEQVWLFYAGHSSVTIGNHEMRGRDIFNIENNSQYRSFIVPVDYLDNGFISDVSLRNNFVKRLNPKSRCVAFFDSVHHTSPLNLRFRLTRSNRVIIETKVRGVLAKIICICNRTCKRENFEEFLTGTLQDSATFRTGSISTMRKNAESLILQDILHGLQTYNTSSFMLTLKNGKNVIGNAANGVSGTDGTTGSTDRSNRANSNYNITVFDLVDGMNSRLKREMSVENVLVTTSVKIDSNTFVSLFPQRKRNNLFFATTSRELINL